MGFLRLGHLPRFLPPFQTLQTGAIRLLGERSGLDVAFRSRAFIAHSLSSLPTLPSPPPVSTRLSGDS